MSKVPEDLKYSNDHEWVKVDGKIVTIGITDYAQDQLGDIVYVELPAAGKEFKVKEEFGVVESVKSVSSLFSPVAGKVVDVNAELSSSSQIVNQDPYGKAWMIKVEMSNPSDVDSLLSAEDYIKILAK
ncbi:MAG: glycine cleavage system protein GcvH [Candidatus Margulisiibacteriota bacterium]